MVRFDDLFLAQYHPIADVEFGESVLYTPVNVEARNIRASISNAQVDEIGDEEHTEEREVILVYCQRSKLDGIDEPNVGDTITREVENDPDNRPFVFADDIRTQDTRGWTLVFWRHKLRSDGSR